MSAKGKAEHPGSAVPVRPLASMGVRELETLRLILRGGSVVDWKRLDFETREV